MLKPTLSHSGPVPGEHERAAAQLGAAAHEAARSSSIASSPNVRCSIARTRSPRISEWRGHGVVAERTALDPLLEAARVDLLGVHAHREQGADERAHADAGDAVDL